MKNAMDKYGDYQTEDFLRDESFINWVLNPEDANNRLWADWVKSNPHKEETVRKAIDIISSFDFKQEPVAENFYTDLKQSIDQTIGHKKQQATLFPKWLSIAAIVGGILFGGAVVYYFLQPSYTVVSTPYAATKTVWLPDSSEVVLNANSSIRYLSNWHKHKREVWINGEAFFKIRSITTAGEIQQFKVYADNTEIEVLGTEFNVKNIHNVTGVMLQKGKVKFSVPARKMQTIMHPDDYCQYNASLGKIIASPADPELYTSWMKHKYKFEKTPASEVCQTLTAYFGYGFIFRHTELAKQHISGTLELQNEQLMLSTLSELLNASITKSGQDIIIE